MPGAGGEFGVALLVSLSGVPGRWRASVAVTAGLVALAVGTGGMPATAVDLPTAPVPAADPPAPAERTVAGHLFAPDAVSARSIARLENEAVEVIGDRTTDSSTYALPNGNMVSQLASGPVWVPQGGDGTKPEDWAAVDLTLVAGDDGAVAAVAQPGGVVLAGESDGSPEAPVTLATMTDPETGAVVHVEWPGALPEPVLAENRATYEEVAPGLDVVVEISSTGFEQFYVAHDEAAAQAALAMPLTITSEGATLAATEDGGLEVAAPSGEVIASGGTPLAWDATVDAALDRPVLGEPVATTAPVLPPLPPLDALMAKESPSAGQAAPKGKAAAPATQTSGESSLEWKG